MEIQEGKTMGTQTLLPVFPVRTDNGGDGIFVNAGLRVKDTDITGSVLIAPSDRSLNGQRDLGIRDKRSKKKCMSMSAYRTENTGNTKRDDLISHPDFTGITTIPDQAGGVSASTGDLVEIKGTNGFIIKILRNRVVKIHFNSYHNIVHGTEKLPCVLLEAGFKLWSGRVLLS